MGSVYEEITRLETAKADIETAIEGCGVNVPDTDLISTYALYIRQIPSAVFSELNVDPVGGEDQYIKSIKQTNGLIEATTGGLVSSTSSGLAPKIGTSASSTISAQANEWVLTSTKGGSPTWRKLPSNAFKNDNTNTTYSLSGALSGNTYITTLTDSASGTTTATVPAMSGASSTAAGTAGLVPAPAANKHTAFLRGDGTWVVPTNTNYYRPISVNGTSILGNNNTALNLVAGTNISITAENSSGYTGKVTITNTGVRSVATGTTNGTISVNTNGTSADVAVKGLGSAAYTSKDLYQKLTTYVNNSGEVDVYKKITITKSDIEGYGIWLHSRQLHYLLNSGAAAMSSPMNTFWELGTNYNSGSTSRTISVKMVATASSATVTLYILVRAFTYILVVSSGTIEIIDSTKAEYDSITSNTTGWVACQTAKWTDTTYSVVSSSANGLAPKVINTNGRMSDTYYVLASSNGSNTPSWYKLPANAFKNDNTTYTFVSGNGDFTVTPSGGTAQTVSIGKPATAGAADVAVKLQTKRKLWGLDFDGSADVSGDMTGVGNITINATGNKDYFINFLYNSTPTYSWRLGYLGSGSADANYFVIDSSKSSGGTWHRALQIGNETLDATFTGTVIAPTFKGNLDGTYVNKLTGYTKSTTASNIAATDSLNTALGKLEYKAHYAYNWVTTVTATDTDEYINKWGEIVGFLDSVKEETDILDEFVTRKTDLTITGIKTFNKVINITNSGGSWVSGMTNAAIKYDSLNALNTSSYHPIIGVKTNAENVVNFGAYINEVGFYGYKKGRTENSYDWLFKFNSETGAITHTGTSITANKYIGTLNSTLTFSAGAFSAKTYNNSAAVTVNIPTHTSHLTNNSGFLTSRGYIGTTAVQASSAAQALTGITNLTMNGTYTNNNKLTIHSSGCVYPYSTSTRTAGMYGKYDSTKVGHVWSMGTDYKIADDGSSTNNMYGLVYFHTNWSNDETRNTATRDGSLITEVSGYAGGHQIAFVVNGKVKVALGDRVWSRAGFLKSGSSDSYVLLGGGGHKALSDFLLETEFASKELSSNLTTITKTLVVSKDWVDTGIVFNAATFPNGTGSYIVQLCRDSEYYWTGYLSIILSRATVNRTDEIILHGGGVDMSSLYYLRTVLDKTTETIKLQIARSSTDTRSLSFTFKFKKLI